MSRKRDLGQILALAGGALAIVAVIAGFVLVGGPGDARDRRLDQMTMNRVATVLNLAQCVFDESDATPNRLGDTKDTRIRNPDGGWPTCALGHSAEQIADLTDTDVSESGSVSYESLSTSRIRICANFRRPSRTADKAACYERLGYAEFEKPHSAGAHCFDIELAKGSGTAPACP